MVRRKRQRLNNNQTEAITRKAELPDDYVVLDFETTGLEHYRLSDVAKHLNVENTQHHRALNDCLVTQKCFEVLREQNETKKNK